MNVDFPATKVRVLSLVVAVVVLNGCASVQLQMPEEPVFVGDYTKVPVRLAGYVMEELEFAIPDGPAGGQISLSRDVTFDPDRPDVMLLAGYKPGDYSLEVRRSADGELLAKGEFSVNAQWKDAKSGPGLWVSGQLPESRGVPGAAWGGGPAGSAQNLATQAASGTRQVNIVLFDTSTKRYTSDAATLDSIRDQWLAATETGNPSANAYYREVSYNQFALNAEVFGPVSLPGAWEDYFDAVEHPQGFDVWRPSNDFYQACATAADDLIAFQSDESLICVSQSIDDTQFAWAYARSPTVTTAEGVVNLGGISMPFDWDVVDGRPIYTTLSHELGHNLGLSDLYTPEVAMNNPPTEMRNVGTWDIMGGSRDPLAHFSLAHRMMLGWVNETDIQLFNFQVQPPPVDATVTIQAIESGAPASGKKSGIEVRIADGWNYYFEYRNDQAGHIADTALPTDNRVFGSDVVSSPFSPPMARPPILKFDNDPDFDGSVLGNGQNYREVDATDPMFPTDFTVTVSGIDGTDANLRVQYGVSSKPDPYIRPWPASSDRQWQSPDIEVINARNASDAAWKNVPWLGNDNTIVASVTNGGSLAADAVEVEFFVKDFNVGPSPAVTPLATDTRDVPALTTVDFTAPWVPPADGHYCVIARIKPYTSTGGVAEISGDNNLAQSNYDRFISASASPPSREISSLSVTNPFAKPTHAFISVSQDNPLYRTYLQHRSLMLDANETRSVQIMFEYAPDAVQLQPVDSQKPWSRFPNDARFVSYIEDPRHAPPDAADLFSGAQVQVATGRATEFKEFAVDGNRAFGRIVTTDTEQNVPGQQVILITTTRDGQRSYKTVAFNSGTFSAGLPREWATAIAYYPGRDNFGDAYSEPIHASN